MRIEEKKITLSFSELKITYIWIKKDLLIIVHGGDQEHIGCSVLAIPRLSLRKNGKTSASSSVLNVIGHKDEALCRELAEHAAAKYNVNVVCTGGFHCDNMNEDKIKEVVNAIKNFEV